MEKNRFSRQLIVLRAVISGYSGHARVIHADHGTEIELRVQSPDAAANLFAVLVDRHSSVCRGTLLGQLHVDERGLATGAFPIDSAEAVPEILAIVQQTDDSKLAMSGFLDGPRSVNWADVRTAACDAIETPRQPAVSLLPRESDVSADAPATEAPAAATAAEAAGVADDAIWPEEIAALQAAFETQPPAEVFPDTRYTFIHIEAGESTPEYYAGICCTHGIPLRAAYAVRGHSRDTCPQGLESFLWRACEDDSGFWTTYIDAETGLPIHDDY